MAWGCSLDAWASNLHAGRIDQATINACVRRRIMQACAIFKVCTSFSSRLVIIEKLVRKDMDKMITKEQNLPANTYRIHAEDVDHPFNWFYLQLLDKESEKNKTQTHAQQSVLDERNDSVQNEIK